MELWIRSQDKTILSKTHVLSVRENQNENNETEYAIQDLYTMGVYNTKERALEVLDEIQSKIKQQFIVKSSALMSLKDIDKEENRLIRKYNKEFIMQDSSFEIVPINDGTIVYEMPEK